MRSRDFAPAKSRDSRRGRTSGAAERRSGSEFAKRMSSGDARRRHRRSPCTRTPPNGSTSESASADRPGPGFRAAKSESDSRRGPHERRDGASARCRRHRSSGDARRRHRRSPRTRTPLNGLTKKSASADRCGRGTLQRKVGKRLERRMGSKKGPSLAGRTFQNIIVANYLFQPGFCPRLGFFIVSV